MSCISVTIRFLITRTSTDQSTIVGIPLGGLLTTSRRQWHQVEVMRADPLVSQMGIFFINIS
jgi:hypothetical protein